MKRIRILGLGAVVALALMAFPAGASATGGMEANSYSFALGFASFPESAYFSTSGTEAEVECQNPYILNDDDEFGGPTDTVPMSAEFLNCGVAGNETIKFNGCRFEFHPGSENSFDIGPPGCGPITGLKFPSCRNFSIGSQTGLPAKFENVIKEGQERVAIQIGTSLKATYTGCTSGTTTTNLSAQWEIGGHSEMTGKPIGIRAVDGFNGFFVAGKKSENEAEQPKFSAEDYPVQVSGLQDAEDPFKITLPGIEGEVTCGSGQYDSELTNASASLDVSANFAKCTHDNSPVTVAMNSCHFTHNLDNVGGGGLYVGGVGIACSKEGDAIEVITPVCTATIASQEPAGTLFYVNQGAGSERSVWIGGGSVEGVNLTYVKGICILLGKNQKEGKLGGAFTLNGP